MEGMFQTQQKYLNFSTHEIRKQWVFCICVFFMAFHVYKRNYLPLRLEMISLASKNRK